MASAESPSFLVDHLASFNATASHSEHSDSGDVGKGPTTLLSPDEAIGKLRQLAMHRGIWTTRVTIVITAGELVVFDAQTNAVMERFPLSLIYRPAAVRSDRADDIYDNIAVITVLGDSKQHLPPEVHIFQSIKHPADRLVSEILAAKSKKSSSHGGVEQRDIEAAVWPERALEYEQGAKRTATALKDFQASQPSKHRQKPMKPPTNAGGNDHVVKSVEVLNRCFDDIEQFMTRLQSVADAFKELEKRRKNRKKKGPQPGDGMLSIRARNPPDVEIFSILQKFKVCFNLLARLKSHIHNPNSPELVHFLFTPLSLIIEASRDPKQPGDIASTVIAPLLTPSAISLLQNCLTSKEMELWLALGDAWIKSRSDWVGQVPAYQLQFLDGSQPDRVYWDEDMTSDTSLTADRARSLPQVTPEQRLRAHINGDVSTSLRESVAPPRDMRSVHSSNHDYLVPQRPTDMPQYVQHRPARSAAPPTLMPKPFHATPAIRDFDAQDRFLREIQHFPSRVYQAMQTRDGENRYELSIVKGDILEVLDGSRNWWRVRNYRNEIAHVPYTLLQPFPVGSVGGHGQVIRR